MHDENFVNLRKNKLKEMCFGTVPKAGSKAERLLSTVLRHITKLQEAVTGFPEEFIVRKILQNISCQLESERQQKPQGLAEPRPDKQKCL